MLLVFISCFSSVSIGRDYENKISWREVAPIPKGNLDKVQHGLAAPFAGHSNGKIIVAGGCNFPDALVYEGGIKRYYSDIFVYDEDKDIWTHQSIQFPYPVAYGASVSIEEGIVCIGGNNLETSLSEVYLMSWNDT